MPRHKPSDCHALMLPVVLSEQIVPGSFSFALNYLVDHELDLSALDARVKNDAVGASAYDPRVVLKIVMLAYSQGLISGSIIASACARNVQFIVISGDSQPSHAHIAKFVVSLTNQTKPLFAQVLMTCDAQGLIGREMFAIDGVKLPSNASKERSGTHEELSHRAERLDKAADKILALHQAQDKAGAQEALEAKRQARIDALRQEAARTRAFVSQSPKRLNNKGQELKSNITDPDSAKMATNKGVIQGYAAQAAVDSANQIIVAAEVTGSGSEQNMLLPMIEATQAVREANTLITADAGYHSSDNVNALCEACIPALIADNQMRQRNERYPEQAKHKVKGEVLHDKRRPDAKPSPNPKVKGLFSTADFEIHDDNTCTCPAGCTLRSSSALYTVGRYQRQDYKTQASDCQGCALRRKCIRNPDTLPRKIAVHCRMPDNPQDPLHRMRAALDSARGRGLYSQRIATVEPVFGNLRHNKRVNRFTVRGKIKVGTHGSCSAWCTTSRSWRTAGGLPERGFRRNTTLRFSQNGPQ